MAGVNNFVFSKRSSDILADVHPDLAAVMALALTLTPIDFTVYHGRRTIEQQRAFVEAGKSRTMNSRHLTGHAVDFAPWQNGGIDWDDIDAFKSVIGAVKEAARVLDVPIECGGDWGWDFPHIQLDWLAYPKEAGLVPKIAQAAQIERPQTVREYGQKRDRWGRVIA